MVVVMVGLPGRHKTFTARSLARYLRWIGYRVAVLSVADLRRQKYGTDIRASFFDPRNKETIEKRTVIADMALGKIIILLEEGNMQIVILDASNTTTHRREIIVNRLGKGGDGGKNYKILFIECISNDEQVAEDPSELDLEYPEYIGLPYDLVFNDFIKRIAFYKPHYVQLGMEDGLDREKSFVRIINGGARIELHQVSGYISTKMVFFLMNLNPKERIVWLSCAQDSKSYKRISELALEISPNKLPVVWIPTRPQYNSVSNFFTNFKIQSSLCEQEMGVASNMSDKELAQIHPEEWSKYQQNPFKYRWPRAESHKDLAIRLENIIMQIFKYQGHLIIFADPTVLACIYGYFVEECWDWWSKKTILNNMHEIVEIRPRAYGSYESVLNVENGQTTRESKLRAHLELLNY